MNMEWTHKKVKITDIRKVYKFYIISINDKNITSPLFVDQSIFNNRVNSYYLRNDFKGDIIEHGMNIERDDVLNVFWNMIITKGFFYKTSKDSEPEKIYKDPDKFYISFLEIDGPLGTYVPIN